MRNPRLPLALVLLLAAGSAAAHPGHEPAGFFTGFVHPLGGLDHFLVMLTVGLLAARQGGAARWALPVGFLLAMLAAAGLAWAGLPFPAAEAGIAASLLALGLLLATPARLPLAASLPLVAACALGHGYAHGAEMGAGSLLGYAAGFTAASGLLHGAGYVLARCLPERPWAIVLRRVMGTAIAGTGLLLLGA